MNRISGYLRRLRCRRLSRLSVTAEVVEAGYEFGRLDGVGIARSGAMLRGVGYATAHLTYDRVKPLSGQ